MKSVCRFLILITGILVFACAPKPGKTPGRPEADTGEKMFQTAERLFEAKSYDKARKIYRDYYRSYPKRSAAPAALLKIGEIDIIKGNISSARAAFDSLIAEYPDSPFVQDAKIATLGTYYHEGDLNRVIRQAGKIPEDRLSPNQAFRLFTLLADTATDLGDPADAFYYLGKALASAPDPVKAALRKRLKATLGRLDPDGMTLLLDRIGSMEARGYLLYELALVAAKAERYDAAIGWLTELTEMYPDHELTSESKTLIDALKVKLLYQIGKKGVYSRYTVGCLLPLSGPYKYYGNRALKGIELALNDFSSDEMNPTLTVFVKDTRSDPDHVLEAVSELDEENVAGIIGPITTAVAAAFEAQDRKIPIITWTQRDDINIIGDYVFRNFITPKMQIETIVPYVMHERDYSRFAILYPNETYGSTYMNLFWDEVIAQGGKVVGVESYDPNGMDFADPIRKLVGLFYDVPEDLKPEPPPPPPGETESAATPAKEKADEPEAIVDFDAIFIPDAPKKTGLVIPQLAYYDIENVCLMGTHLWNSDRLIEMAGQYAQGAILADGFFAESGAEVVRKFTRKFEAAYGKKPGFIEAIAYDTAMIIFNTVRRPEIGSRAALKDELLKIENFEGVTGLTAFDETGDCRKRLYLLRLKKKRFVEVQY
jgi:branched-chain amino acid transport system substrate-binding protein